MEPNRRLFRVKELLKHEVAECLRREFAIGSVGLLTVNDVGVAGDLRSATVFVGFVGNAKQREHAQAELARHAKRIQTIIGSGLRLRYTPELRFQLNDSVEQGQRIIALLDELERTSPPLPPLPPAV